MNDGLKTLQNILARNGHVVNLRENEADRYFLFDRISNPGDLDLAWSQFQAHREIRARAAEVDAVSDIVAGWGYRIPKASNRCSDAELVALVRDNLAATLPFITESWDDVAAFIENGYDVRIVGGEESEPRDAMENDLFMALYESMGDFKLDHFPFDQLLSKVLYDWSTYLTKCDEVALYLLWPVLKDVGAVDPKTPIPAFKLWQYSCRTNYWIKDGEMASREVCVRRPWPK